MNTIPLEEVLNTTFSLRRFLTDKKYHTSKSSVPKSVITPENEPRLFEQIYQTAKEINENPDSILIDDLSKESRVSDWKTLVEKEVIVDGKIISIDTRSRPGHKILDHYMRNIWDVKNHKGISVRNVFTQGNLEAALLLNIRSHSTPYKSEIRRMLVMSNPISNVTKYRALTTKAIVQYFGAKRVLDPCIGWGGRMLGTLAAGDDTLYAGCEPDTNTAANLRKILTEGDLPQTSKSRVILLELPAEKGISQFKKMEKFDMILTSPPYFNLEIYTSGEQSTLSYTTWEEWSEKWLKTLILSYLSCLKSNGVSCWNVKNIRTDVNCPLADFTKKIHTDAGWNLVKIVSMKGSGRMGAKRIEDGAETRDSEEQTFCFRRT